MAARMETMQSQIDELRNEKGLPSGMVPGRSTPADLDVIKSNQAHLVKLVTTLQTHVGEEHVHRVNGQQELREICSAEISARRKAAAKTDRDADLASTQSTGGAPKPTFVAETEPLTADLFRTHEVNNFLRAVVVVQVWEHRELGDAVRMSDLLLPICVEYKRPIKLLMSAIPPSHAGGGSRHRNSATNLGVMGRRVSDGRTPAGGGQFHLRNSTAPQDGDTNMSSSPRQPSALYFPSAVTALRKTITNAASRHDRNNDSNNGSVENSEAVIF